tara:strand:- start:26742 stop:27326 length:585 start_codon:yes stop_codon:yes gene_type:complete
MELSEFIDINTQNKVIKWLEEFNTELKIVKPCKSRSGVFIPCIFSKNIIKINDNLNKYSFLITLIHEIAHASIWKKFGRSVKPHGKEWKKEFQRLFLPFLNPDYFPEDILRILSLHMISPKSTTYRDIALSKALMKYDRSLIVTISDIKNGTIFTISNGRRFIKISKLRKNYKCKELNTDKYYIFSPLSQVFDV